MGAISRSVARFAFGATLVAAIACTSDSPAGAPPRITGELDREKAKRLLEAHEAFSSSDAWDSIGFEEREYCTTGTVGGFQPGLADGQMYFPVLQRAGLLIAEMKVYTVAQVDGGDAPDACRQLNIAWDRVRNDANSRLHHIRYQLTPKALAAGFTRDKKNWLPHTKRQVFEVTGISANPDGTYLADFVLGTAVVPSAIELGVPNEKPRRQLARATFRKYDDGWRLEEIAQNSRRR